MLEQGPVPPLEEINEQEEFTATVIPAEEFEQVWAAAKGALPWAPAPLRSRARGTNGSQQRQLLNRCATGTGQTVELGQPVGRGTDLSILRLYTSGPRKHIGAGRNDLARMDHRVNTEAVSDDGCTQRNDGKPVPSAAPAERGRQGLRGVPPGNRTSPYPPCERPIRSNRLCAAHNQQRGRQRAPPYPTAPAGHVRVLPWAWRGGVRHLCGLPGIGKGLCNGHYQQEKRGGELMPLFTKRISQDEAYLLLEAGLKRCPACKNVKALTEFGRSSAQLSGRSTYCVACQPNYVLMKRFGFPSMEAVRAFRDSRDDRCDICKRQRRAILIWTRC